MAIRSISHNAVARACERALLAGAALYVVACVVVCVTHLAYPFELEVMEGGSVVHVQRVLDGEPLYVAPSLAFVPYIYTPLYYDVGALVASVAGAGYLPLRLVSFLSSLGTLVLIFAFVRRRTASPFAAVVAAGLFAATFRISGAWFALARVDALFVFLLVAATVAFDSPRPIARMALAPVLLFLAFFTKQTAGVVAAGFAFAALSTRRRHERYALALVFAVLAAGAFAFMNARTSGWFRYYVFDLPREHELYATMIVNFWKNDIAGWMPVALAIALLPMTGFTAGARAAHSRDDAPGRVFRDACVLGGFLLASYASRVHTGGYDNVLMPAHAGIAMYFGAGLGEAMGAARDHARVRIVLAAAVILQFAPFAYSLPGQMPTTRDRRRGDAIEKRIAAIPGDVYLADHPWYLGALGRPTQANTIAVRDIVRADPGGSLARGLGLEMAAAVASQRYDAIIVDYRDFDLRPPDFDAYYTLADSTLSGDALHLHSGWDRRPTYLYLPRVNPDTAPSSRP